MAIIHMEEIRKIYDTGKVKVEALKGVDLQIEQGELVAIVGPSGSGKSTLMNLLGCLDTPTSGRYWLNGRAADRLSTTERARIRNVEVGLVFQSFNLLGDLTVFENVEYPLTLRGVAAPDRQVRGAATADRSASRSCASRRGREAPQAPP